MKRYFVGLAVLALVAVGGGLGFLYSGIYNVSALHPPGALKTWVLHTTMRRSVARHARGIAVPKLSKGEVLARGAAHYHEMCVSCHGAPGREPSELARSLNPPPPALAKAAHRLPPAQSFWVVKHGIEMTGMPAWGRTHDDSALWVVTLFAQRLPEMTPAQYERLVREAPKGMDP